MGPNFDVSAPPAFVTEFSNILQSLNIKLVGLISVCLLCFVNYVEIRIIPYLTKPTARMRQTLARLRDNSYKTTSLMFKLVAETLKSVVYSTVR